MHLKGADHYNPSNPQHPRPTKQAWWFDTLMTLKQAYPLEWTRGCNMRSKIRWFTEFCNSHYISQFAAFFIDARTKRSIVESCFTFAFKLIRHSLKIVTKTSYIKQSRNIISISFACSAGKDAQGIKKFGLYRSAHPNGLLFPFSSSRQAPT
jgi:hypothetical protein